MYKTRYHIPGVDCPSEERMIRMKLEGLPINHLQFDLPGRTLTVLHYGAHQPISSALQGLNMGATHQHTEEAEADLAPPMASAEAQQQQRKVLIWVLLINFFFFVAEAGAGWWYESVGLLSDALDMLADAMVYGLSLIAIRQIHLRKRVARLSGIVQMVLAIGGMAEVVRRFVGLETEPDFGGMMAVSLAAMLGNIACLLLLTKTDRTQTHMQASWIFTSNDVIANGGVIVAGGLVWLTASPLPDLIVGSIIFCVVAWGAVRILRLG